MKIKLGSILLFVCFGLFFAPRAFAATKLLGSSEEINGNKSADGALIYANPFTAVATGTMDEVHFYTPDAQTVSIAVYSDLSGAPDARLSLATFSTVGTGWYTETYPTTSITSGTTYWIAVNQSRVNSWLNDTIVINLRDETTFADPFALRENYGNCCTLLVAGYDSGASPTTPTDTATPEPLPPANGGGPGDGQSDGRSDGLSSCPSCTAAPSTNVPGASTGQVLGASTTALAATGSNDQLGRIMMGAVAAFVVFLWAGSSLVKR